MALCRRTHRVTNSFGTTKTDGQTHSCLLMCSDFNCRWKSRIQMLRREIIATPHDAVSRKLEGRGPVAGTGGGGPPWSRDHLLFC